MSDANFGLVLFTLHVYLMINYNDKINRFTISDGDRSNWFETNLLYIYGIGYYRKVMYVCFISELSYIGLTPNKIQIMLPLNVVNN